MFIVRRRMVGVLAALAVPAALALISSVWDGVPGPEVQATVNGSAAHTATAVMVGLRLHAALDSKVFGKDFLRIRERHCRRMVYAAGATFLREPMVFQERAHVCPGGCSA